jgi:hypothetical protein
MFAYEAASQLSCKYIQFWGKARKMQVVYAWPEAKGRRFNNLLP